MRSSKNKLAEEHIWINQDKQIDVREEKCIQDYVSKTDDNVE